MSGIQVSKWGNSLGVRLPAVLSAKAQLSAGDMVDISLDEAGRLIVAKIERSIDFKALYMAIEPDAREPEVRTSFEVGGEVVEW